MKASPRGALSRHRIDRIGTGSPEHREPLPFSYYICVVHCDGELNLFPVKLDTESGLGPESLRRTSKSDTSQCLDIIKKKQKKMLRVWRKEDKDRWRTPHADEDGEKTPSPEEEEEEDAGKKRKKESRGETGRVSLEQEEDVTEGEEGEDTRAVGGSTARKLDRRAE
ncbi:hypothetical protein NDU88_002438 [Pleurodeles waltl]|uniref:Uncharacterized protein n=1 Tax=Pleurodeles waltl TaxID=8319 RepID=A0AAV7UYN6_PLEWA|nr:hypothetical protein NDU88_002438 [Pleurodeles waltl]